MEDGPKPQQYAVKWYYCRRHKHWWTDRPDIDSGMPTGFNKGEKDCATRQYSAKAEYYSRETYI